MLRPKFILIFLIGNAVNISSGKFVSNPESWKVKFDEGEQKKVEQSRGASLDAGCPEGHTKNGTHCYFPSFKDGEDFIGKRSWKGARDFCRELTNTYPSMSYDLVSLQDANEYDFILSNDWSVIYKTWKEQFAIWIGLNDRDEEGDWRWSDESPFEYPIPYLIANYPPWFNSNSNREPNNGISVNQYGLGNENCVRTKGLLGLNDVDCKIEGAFICEGYSTSDDVDGKWTSWKYTTCSSSCEGGTRIRRRTCNNPKPQNEGKQCSGEEEEEIPCNTEAKCNPDNKCSGAVTSSIYEETCDPASFWKFGDNCRYEIGDKSSSRTEGFNSCPTTYEKRPQQHCGVHGYGNYQTLEAALRSCSKDEGCTGVDDRKCEENTNKEFRLCTKDPYYRRNNDQEEMPVFWKLGACRYVKKFTTCNDIMYNFNVINWWNGHFALSETISELDESKLIDYTYPWATFSDSPMKIKITMNRDHKFCGTSKVVNETIFETTTDKVAKAIGRIPGDVRGAMTHFSMTSGCGDEAWWAFGTSIASDFKNVLAAFKTESFEETLLHELSHINFKGYNYLDSDYACAQNLDAKKTGKALTWYGKHHRREAEAESFLFWYALKSVHGRIKEEVKDEILAVAPYRMELYDAVMSP